jgi:hypothetical protein
LELAEYLRRIPDVSVTISLGIASLGTQHFVVADA